MKIHRSLLAMVVAVLGVSTVRATEVPVADATSPMVAKVGDMVLTEAQMRNDLAFGLYEAEMGVYQVKRNWVDEKSRQYLFDKAAKEAKLSRKEWEKREIDAKILTPTDADVDQIATQMARGQLPTDPEKLAALKTQGREYLMGQRRQAQENQVYNLLIQRTPIQLSLLAPAQPNIEIAYTKDNPVKGPKDAPVTVMEFTDFECPWCSRAQESLKAVENTYKGKVKIITRHFPLQMHAQAFPAAVAAVCAQNQGKFWEMHDKLFANQQALADADLQRYAKDLGLNVKKFNKCRTEESSINRVRDDMAAGTKYGVRGTPTFFVNGQRANFNQLNDFVKAELEKKK